MMRYTHMQQHYGSDQYCPSCLQKMPRVNTLGLDEQAHCVVWAGDNKRHLTPLQFDVFKLLYVNYDKIVTKAQLQHVIDAWHHHNKFVCHNYLSVTLCTVRIALRGSGSQIRNEWGLGYMLTAGEWAGQYGAKAVKQELVSA